MLYILQISPKAVLEFEDLLDWYLKIDIRIGEKFADEYFTALNKIVHQPKYYSFIAPHKRRIPFKTMKAMLVYIIKKDMIEVIAVKDMRSKPDKHFY
jgi:hypothetical protein